MSRSRAGRSVTAVAAKELGALGISGPGIKGELKLDNAGEMMKLEQSGFFDLSHSIKAPQGLGEGYTIVRYLHMEEGLIAWDKLGYFPDPAGKQGYLNYQGSVDKNHDGMATIGWYRVGLGTDQVFQGLLAAHGVAVAASASALTASTAKQPPVESKANVVAQPAAGPAAGPATDSNAVAVPATQANAPASTDPAAGSAVSSPAMGLMLGIGVVVALIAVWAWLRRRQRVEPVSVGK